MNKIITELLRDFKLPLRSTLDAKKIKNSEDFSSEDISFDFSNILFSKLNSDKCSLENLQDQKPKSPKKNSANEDKQDLELYNIVEGMQLNASLSSAQEYICLKPSLLYNMPLQQFDLEQHVTDNAVSLANNPEDVVVDNANTKDIASSVVKDPKADPLFLDKSTAQITNQGKKQQSVDNKPSVASQEKLDIKSVDNLKIALDKQQGKIFAAKSYNAMASKILDLAQMPQVKSAFTEIPQSIAVINNTAVEPQNSVNLMDLMQQTNIERQDEKSAQQISAENLPQDKTALKGHSANEKITPQQVISAKDQDLAHSLSIQNLTDKSNSSQKPIFTSNIEQRPHEVIDEALSNVAIRQDQSPQLRAKAEGQPTAISAKLDSVVSELSKAKTIQQAQIATDSGVQAKTQPVEVQNIKAILPQSGPNSAIHRKNLSVDLGLRETLSNLRSEPKLQPNLKANNFTVKLNKETTARDFMQHAPEEWAMAESEDINSGNFAKSTQSSFIDHNNSVNVAALNNISNSAFKLQSSKVADVQQLAHIDRLNQIAEIKVTNVKQSGPLVQMDIELKPEGLGKVVAHMHVVDNKLEVKITAHNYETSRLLSLNEDLLKDAINKVRLAEDKDLKIVIGHKSVINIIGNKNQDGSSAFNSPHQQSQNEHYFSNNSNGSQHQNQQDLNKHNSFYNIIEDETDIISDKIHENTDHKISDDHLLVI